MKNSLKDLHPNEKISVRKRSVWLPDTKDRESVAGRFLLGMAMTSTKFTFTIVRPGADQSSKAAFGKSAFAQSKFAFGKSAFARIKFAFRQSIFAFTESKSILVCLTLLNTYVFFSKLVPEKL